jgi:hypothetical protein
MVVINTEKAPQASGNSEEGKLFSFYFQCIKNEFIILAQQKSSYLLRSFIPGSRAA